MLEAGLTGLNTRSGDLMALKIKPAGTSLLAKEMRSQVNIILQSDQIMEIRHSGVQIFD